MGRVFYLRHITPSQLEAYEALGWELVGGRHYSAGSKSVTVQWDRDAEPVEPAWDRDVDSPAPAVIAPLSKVPNTRDVLRWNFAPFDLVCVIALAIAGLFWGVIDKVRK